MELNNELLQCTVDLCKQEGAKDVVVKAVQKDEHQIRFSNSQIDILKDWFSNTMNILVARGKHTKFILIQNPSKSKITAIIPKALRNLASEPKSFLYWGIEKKHHTYPPYPELADHEMRNFTDRAPDYVNSAIHASMDVGSEKVAGVLYWGENLIGVLTSRGNGGIYPSSFYRMTVRSFFDAESTGQDIVAGRSLQNIESKFAKAGQNSAEIAKMAVNGVQGKAGTYDVILSPTVGGNIFGELVSGANPLRILAGMSSVGEKVGKQIGPESLTVHDDPTHPEGIGSYPFDIEGMPAKKTPIIEGGKLVNLLHNTSTARFWSLVGLMGKGKIGSKSTGNSDLGYIMVEGVGPQALFPRSSNFVYKAGDSSLEEMIEDSQKPTIYLTSNWYTRFTNQIEGTFSTIPRDGSFLIENGEIKQSIRKIRLSDNLLKMSANISAMGKKLPQIQWWEAIIPSFIPAIKVENCQITTATD
ncbi:MAG: TldD/PmbA family protein [Theionarchaea archaeon]|nr:TldD/PmbA family protein [Theionarchaea archaeon]